MLKRILSWFKQEFGSKRQTLFEHLSAMVRAQYTSRVANNLLEDRTFRRYMRQLVFAYTPEWEEYGKLSLDSKKEIRLRLDVAAKRWAVKKLIKLV